MPLIEYTRGDFGRLSEAVGRVIRTRQFHPALDHRPFVDYYYTDQPWSKLYLFASAHGQVNAVIGVERLRFLAGSSEVEVAFGTNLFSLEPALGGQMYLRWMVSAPVGMVFGGSEDTHALVRSQGWTYYPGVQPLRLNPAFGPIEGEPGWRRLMRRVLQRRRYGLRRPLTTYGRAIADRIPLTLEINPEDRLSEDMIPLRSPFAFRFAPTAEYLRWRYATDLPFVRYRLFRLLLRGANAGYVILQVSPRRVVVSHCDGTDPSTLAWGVLLCILEVGRSDLTPREAMLASSHPDMQAIFRSFGFRPTARELPLAMGSLRGSIELPTDTSDWLVNFDWGDNGLRHPFLDEPDAKPSHH